MLSRILRVKGVWTSWGSADLARAGPVRWWARLTAASAIDYLSLHACYEQHGDDRASFLAASAGMDRFIDRVVATADYVAAKKRSRKKLMLSFDEWNLWQESRFAGHTNLEWERAPRLIEDTYTVQDAVVFGSLLMSLLRHCDRVAIACLA